MQKEGENNNSCEKVLYEFKHNPEGEKNEDQIETIFKEKTEIFRKLRHQYYYARSFKNPKQIK